MDKQHRQKIYPEKKLLRKENVTKTILRFNQPTNLSNNPQYSVFWDVMCTFYLFTLSWI
jgi:hypothetical protein